MKLSFFVCCGLLSAVMARAETNNVRSLTLQEAIQLSVQHNLRVQIERLTPQIDKFNLEAAYGAYDPEFRVGGSETYIKRGQAFNPEVGSNVPASESHDQNYFTGFRGVAPWGLNYDISGNLDRVSSATLQNGFRIPRRDQYETFTGITLTQPLLRGFWGYQTPRYNISIAKQNIKYDEWRFRGTLIDVISATEQAYYELIYTYENIKVQQAALDLAEQLVRENRRRVEVGTLAPLDEKQAESQAAASRADLIAAHGLLDAQQNVLKNLITDQYSAWRDVQLSPAQKLVVMPERFDLQDSWQKGIAMRPDLMQAKIELERRNITLKYNHNQIFPQLDLTGSYGRSGLANSLSPSLGDIRDERLPSYSFGAVLTIPLSNRAARYNYKASKATVQQALLGLKEVEQTVLVEIDNAIKTAKTDYQRVQATRSEREYAELALEAEQKKLEVGKSTSFEVLTLQKNLTDARSREIRAMADYNKDISTITQRMGSTLDKFNITVQIY